MGAIKASLLLAVCAAVGLAQTTKVALVSDTHGLCSPVTRSGKGNSYLCDQYTRGAFAQVRAATPDYIASSGDLSDYGVTGEYLGAVVTSSTTVAAGSNTITASSGDFYVPGSETYAGGPFIPSATMWAAVEEETPANFELAQVTAIGDSTHATITFAKAHTAPYTVRIGAFGPIQDYMYAGKVGATIGNHDAGGGGLELCATNLVVYPWAVACPYAWGYTTEFTALANLFTDTVGSTAGVPVGGTQTGGWWTKEVGAANAKVTIIGARWDNSTYNQTQEQALHATLTSCPSRWCVALVHASPYGTGFCGSFAGYANMKWLSQAGVDLVSSGHCHAYARITGADYSGDRPNFTWVINGWGGNAGDAIVPESCTGCTVQASVGGSSTTAGYTLVTATRRNLSVQAIDSTGAVRDSATVGTKTRMFPMPGFANR